MEHRFEHPFPPCAINRLARVEKRSDRANLSTQIHCVKAFFAMQKPHEAEEEYFAKLEVEKKCKVFEKKRSEMKTKEVENLKETHHMHCAECGFELETIVFKGLSVNKCFHCGGAYLSKEAFQKLCGQDNKFLTQFLEIFQFKK